jgi:TRAP-type C4-dicarboxylate transport system permease small subunit
MNYIIKQIILLSIIFILISWFQYYDNIKNNIPYEKISLYNKIKLPLLVCAIIGFILNLNLNIYNNDDLIAQSKKKITIIIEEN